MVSLLKYEFKSTGRIFLPIYGILIAFCFVMGITSSPLGSDAYNYSSTMFTGLQFLIFFGLTVAILVLTLVITIQRFYHNLLGDEGYLMFTLPVSTHSLILSKLLVASCWFILSGLVVTLGFLLLIGGSLSDMWYSMEDFFALINPLFLQNAALYLIEYIARTITGAMSSVLMIYASIAVGHLSNKRRGLMSFFVFLGFFVAQSILATTILSVTLQPFFADPYSFLGSDYEQWQRVQSLFQIGLSVIWGGVYYVITRHVLANKLNLE